jgi:hypothetical protein
MGKDPARPLNLEIRPWSPELEAGVLQTLNTSFSETWGDSGFWRWKHTERPGFSAEDVIVFTDGGEPVACFHVAVHPLRLAPGLDTPWSVEGDYAIRPQWRGAGIFEKSNLRAARYLAHRGVVLRGGFSTAWLHERLYKPKLGHRLVANVTMNYRKVLSDQALRVRVQDFGNRLRLQRLLRPLLAAGPVTVQLSVEGFSPCTLVIETDAANCTGQLSETADVRVSIPYELLTVGRSGYRHAFLAVVRAVSSGQVRIRGLIRLLARWASASSRS